MKSNPCGTAPVRIYATKAAGDVPAYFGSGVNPANSPAQFFVAWGEGVLAGGFLPTHNRDTPASGFLWFIDEDEAEARFNRWPQP